MNNYRVALLPLGVCIFGLVWVETQCQTKLICIGLDIFQSNPNQTNVICQTDSNQTKKSQVGLGRFNGFK